MKMGGKRKPLSFNDDEDSASNSVEEGVVGCSGRGFAKLGDATMARFRDERDRRKRDAAGISGGNLVDGNLSKRRATDMVDTHRLEVVIGSYMSRGPKTIMEDFVTETDALLGGSPARLVGVFDGHNGARTAGFLTQRLLPEMATRLDEAVAGARRGRDVGAVKSACIDAFKSVENELLQGLTSKRFNDGSTACVVVVHGERLICANCGDTRAILVSNSSGDSAVRGAALRSELLSFDHKVEGTERTRIEAAGGKIIFKGVTRVCIKHVGVSVSRSFGDLQFKHGNSLPKGEALLLCTPHVLEQTLRPDNLFAIVATDGLWDVVSADRAAKVVSEIMNAGRSDIASVGSGWTHEKACACAQALVDEAMRSKTEDNIAVYVVGFEWVISDAARAST